MLEPSAARIAHFERLLEHLTLTRAFDFTAYKRATLMRRVQRRMQEIAIAEFSDYQDYLEVHPDEVGHLFNVILINVTAFFRDEAVWNHLRAEIAPALVADSAHDIRIWSAGCASGQEAYSLAMLLADAAGPAAFADRVKIYATDIDDEALREARAASYTEGDLATVPADLRARFFDQQGSRFVLNRDLRRAVVFGRHDLLQDAPISRVALLSCRNAIMYFNAEAQARVIDRFEFALRPGGYLLLGKAEMLLGRGAGLAPVDLKLRLFRKSPAASGDARSRGSSNEAYSVSDDSRLRELALDADPTAQMLVDADGRLQVVNERARILFALSPDDIGRPFKDLEISYRPVELRSVIDRAVRERQPATVGEVRWTSQTGDAVALDVHVLPLTSGMLEVRGVKVLFAETTELRRLEEQLKHTNQALETAYEELQSTNEELETTNEELQSTVEELETTNEELQSTNEELETMNEELQSTNEELHTANSELRSRGEDLNRANGFLESILRTLDEGVIVVDHELRVEAWNARAHDMWGLRSDEVQGRHLANLDIGLPVAQLLPTVRGCLAGDETRDVVLEALNRRGRTVRVKAVCSPLTFGVEHMRGAVILLTEESA